MTKVANTVRFEEEVVEMLDANIRTRVTAFMSKGAKWTIKDDGILLVQDGRLLLRVSESYYTSHKTAACM